MTEKQQNEIKCLNYFSLKGFEYTGNDKCNAEEEYFDITQDGKPKKYKNARLEQLLDAQRWRLRMVDMYEQGILDGSVPYCMILFEEPEERWIGKFIKRWRFKEPKKLPYYVIDFLSKTMFKGTDRKLIKEL